MGFRDVMVRSLAGGPLVVTDEEIATAKGDVRTTVPGAVFERDPALAISVSGGEQQVYRDGMERMTARLVEAGNSPERAREIARSAAIRHDRQQAVRTR